MASLGAAGHVRPDNHFDAAQLQYTTRITEVIRQYGVTHILWGSFEPPPFDEINPEAWSDELDKLHTILRLTDQRKCTGRPRRSFFHCDFTV